MPALASETARNRARQIRSVMKLVGSVALGLDEFMLRLGHLKVLLPFVIKTSGNRARMSRCLAEALVAPTRIESLSRQAVAEYLFEKRLCTAVRADGSSETRGKPRYPRLYVRLGESSRPDDVISEDTGPPTVWFQDFCLADPRCPSRVGAVTTDTREITNKSGVSHIVDWAAILGIANKRLNVTVPGRAFAALCSKVSSGNNPYVLGPERLALAWFLFAVDGDVMTQLIMRFPNVGSVKKSDAIALATELAMEMRGRANSPGTSSHAARGVRDMLEDFGLLHARRAASGRTVWHRISSRLESLVDLGFLEKVDARGAARPFDYLYRATPALLEARDGLTKVDSPIEWVESELPNVLTANARNDDVSTELLDAVSLSMAPTGLHIDSFALVASGLAAHHGKKLSMAAARQQLVQLAMDQPDLVRLSRGYSGTRAEFASLDVPKLNKQGAGAFKRNA